jgi:acyl-coenzyme A thioesterase PaaI-like protein
VSSGADGGDPIRSWFPQDAEPTDDQLAKHKLADHLRALIGDVLRLDSAAADSEDLHEADMLLWQARRHIGALPKVSSLFASEQDFSLFERSPFSGRGNALATPLNVEFVGEELRAHTTYGDAYEGPPGTVHGGHVMAAFDDLLGVAQAASGQAGFTGTLSVRMIARTPLHQRIDYEAGVESVSGRKVTAWGRSYCDGELLAEATGIFVVPKGGLHQMIGHDSPR